MKKLLLMVASAAMLFSCSKDVGFDEPALNQETKAFYRKINCSTKFENHHIQEYYYFTGALSSITFREGEAATVINSANTPGFSGSFSTSGKPVDKTYQHLSDQFILFNIDTPDRIDLNFYLDNYYSQTSQFDITVSIRGNNGSSVIAAKSSKTANNSYVMSVDMNAVPPQNDYYIDIDIKRRVVADVFPDTWSTYVVSDGLSDLRVNGAQVLQGEPLYIGTRIPWGEYRNLSSSAPFYVYISNCDYFEEGLVEDYEGVGVLEYGSYQVTFCGEDMSSFNGRNEEYAYIVCTAERKEWVSVEFILEGAVTYVHGYKSAINRFEFYSSGNKVYGFAGGFMLDCTSCEGDIDDDEFLYMYDITNGRNNMQLLVERPASGIGGPEGELNWFYVWDNMKILATSVRYH